MTEAADSSARKAFYVAYQTRAYPKNDAVLREALAARAALAHLLGYPSWSAYVLADRMAGTPERVRGFLTELSERLQSKQSSEMTDLQALAGHPFEAWDLPYYQNLFVKTRYALDESAVRAYFPVDYTLPAIMAIYARLFGVTFTPAAQPHVWDPLVKEYAVAEAGSGRFIGTLYFDLYPRDGKYTHFANFAMLPNRQLENGEVRPPMTAIIGNWPLGAPGKPALLSHDEVVTFFHEFGHAMAALLCTAPYETLSDGFRWDFVEAPSQMLENWAWDPMILKQVSRSATTGEPLPDQLVSKIIANRRVGNGIFFERQIAYSVSDLDYHGAEPPADLSATWAANYAAYTHLTLPPEAHPQASFEHLMGGYDSGYYGYLWSLVYAADLFTAFHRAGLENPKVGQRYVSDILRPAKIYEPDREVEKVLGRPMNPTAFYEELGI
jgi:thimet oligopeptidase